MHKKPMIVVLTVVSIMIALAALNSADEPPVMDNDELAFEFINSEATE